MTTILDITGLSKRFGAVVVADALELRVRQGEALGILGPNGAGKSSLFGMITGTLRQDAGRIEFAGRDITPLSPEARCRAGLNRSFQVPQPFGGMTVFENLLVAARFGAQMGERMAYAECLRILAICGLEAKANEPAHRLRLLDRKRLELARALASRPRLLLLDEVAGGLTEHECHELVALIRTLRAGGITILWIEHVVHALTATVDRLVVLYGGLIIANGVPGEVIQQRQVQEIYMGIETDA
jgi:branched-chain amino acid transport system ATP-binding protein